MLDYIDGYKFSEISDFSIDFDRQDLSFLMLKKDAIIYCKTDFLPVLFNHLRFSNKKYILITHMSDYPIDIMRFSSKPGCIKKWFAENATNNDPDLIPIPIGLENHTGKSKGKFTNHEWLEKNIERLKYNEKEFLLYCNWNPNTNPTREKIIGALKQNNLPIIEQHGLSFETYCENMSKNKFVICPPGNGVDTHRLWEALYLGCIPITIKNRIYNNYDLPIIQVNDWAEVTLELLQKEISNNMEQLYMDYWKTKIKEEFSKL
jgi:hypothetical protein